MTSGLERPPISDRVRLYARTGRRALHRYGFNPSGIFGSLNPRPVFIVGCPRSGTTFTASALGSVSGFADLGEVKRLKAAVPELYRAAANLHTDVVVEELRIIVSRSQRIAMAAQQRGIEQTPESTYLIPEIARAFPQSHFLHLVRDGRDVVSSLIDRGWLAGHSGDLVGARSGGETVDDAGHPFGGYARFWVEAGREAEFEHASEVRRCAWAWRKYVTAALESLEVLAPERVTTIRYEQLATDPVGTATRVATELQVADRSAELAQALSGAHSDSIGKYADTVGADGLAEILDEAGSLLERLGYTD